MSQVVFKTDWLASNPIFYNEKLGKVSLNINDVIDFRNLEFHPEGFNNYLDFGYSILEQTPIKNVKFLRYSSKLIIEDNGKIRIEYLKDPVEKWWNYRLSEDEVIDLIRERVQEWESSVTGDIIIPTSGGYDSRLLNFLIKDKSRIRSFSYGISKNQSKSFEVVYAKKLSEILETKWEQIQLGEFHKYFDEWDNLFGISTHAHGMYHIEFYKKISNKVESNKNLISGIIGDVWAEYSKIKEINNIKELINLGYTHGMNADSSQSLLKSNNYLLENYFINNREKIKDDRFRTIESMRFKIILLSYLLKVPRYFGFNVYAPFLFEDIAMAILNLSKNRRENRKWQSDFFEKNKIDLENMNLIADYDNNLNITGIRKVKPKPLSFNILKEVIDVNYVNWINSKIQNSKIILLSDTIMLKLMTTPKIGGLLRRIGLNFDMFHGSKDISKAYCAYLTLKPIENLIIKRNKA